MNKLDELYEILADVNRQQDDLDEYRKDVTKRIQQLEQEERNKSKTLTLNEDELHKLLCFLETSIIDKSTVSNVQDRGNLIDFRHELEWDIAELFGYDLNEGSIDPKTYKFYTFKSRW